MRVCVRHRGVERERACLRERTRDTCYNSCSFKDAECCICQKCSHLAKLYHAAIQTGKTKCSPWEFDLIRGTTKYNHGWRCHLNQRKINRSSLSWWVLATYHLISPWALPISNGISTKRKTGFCQWAGKKRDTHEGKHRANIWLVGEDVYEMRDR